jgi:hypothetical protein
MGHGEEGISSAAGAKLHQCIWFHRAGSLINLPKEIGQRFHGVLGALVLMRRIVASGYAIHMLAIEFEAVEAPLTKDLSN